MVGSDSFAEFLREQLEPLGRVTMRRVFGKTGVFARSVASSSTSASGARERLFDDPEAAYRVALKQGRGPTRPRPPRSR